MNSSTLSLTIQLPKFEGPLALLLYLIRKEEMDIFDIEIHRITAQYLEFIRMMKELDLEVAGEFVAMASTLIHVKSRMLLPQYNELGEIVENEDPRKELVQRLLEYQKYQEAGKNLYERPLLGRDVWARGIREKFEERLLEEIELEENALYSLITAYRRSARAALKRVHKVSAKTQSIASRILEIKDRLILGTRVALSELLGNTEERRRQLLITFLSSLELAKMGFIRLFQSDAYQEIYLETVQTIEAQAVSSVEEYESLHNESGDGAKELTPMNFDSVADAEPGDFVLKDDVETEEVEEAIDPEEIASDDEILQAEMELDGSSQAPAPAISDGTVMAEQEMEFMSDEELERLTAPEAMHEVVEAEALPETAERNLPDVEA